MSRRRRLKRGERQDRYRPVAADSWVLHSLTWEDRRISHSLRGKSSMPDYVPGRRQAMDGANMH
eukprot:7788936-Pyramimonas_sp.AAC.1